MNATSILFSIVLLVSAPSARSQGVITLTGAPFSATWTETTDTAGIVTTTRRVAARSSDGSVYFATNQNGVAVLIEIDDVPHEKKIQIWPQMKQYTEMAPAPRGKWLTRTTAEQHAIMEYWNAAYSRQSLDQKKDSIPLGAKVVDGMTIYGSHYVRTKDNVRTMEGETWNSDLGFTYSSRSEIFREKKIATLTLTEMKRAEPDASLFIVPSGYTLVQR